jgi:uncharacterized protein (TIGR03000 family)
MGHGGVYNGVWAGGYNGADPHGYGGYSGGYWGCCWLYGHHAAWPVDSPSGPAGYGGFSTSGTPLLPGTTYLSPNLGSPVPPVPAPAIELAPRPLPQKFPEQTSARVRVELPTDARLFVDGTLMKTTSAVRLFLTPALDSNQAYSYELKVELTRNNRTYTEVQRVAVRPGEQASASFAGLEQRAAAAAQSTPATAQR